MHRWHFRMAKHSSSNYSVRIGVWKTKHKLEIGRSLGDQGKCYAFNVAYARITRGDEPGSGDRAADSFAPAAAYKQERGTCCKACYLDYLTLSNQHTHST